MTLTRIVSEETREKMSNTRKRLFAEGIFISPTQGKHLSEETKIKISKANKGKLMGDNNPFRKLMQGPRRKEIIKMMSEVRKGKNMGKKNPFYGKLHSEETKLKMKQIWIVRKKLFQEGEIIPWAKGKKHSEETKLKISKANKGKLLGDNNPFRKLIQGPRREELIRKNKEGHADFKLEKHPCWLGGKSFEPYCPKFNKEFKSIIKLRDNYCCLNCGMSEQTHIILKGKRMTVHHIDYDKKNTCLQNCCTLCNHCNIKANINREQWTLFFQEKLTNKYNYQYSKEELIVNN
jgi:hypothetical protein